jgi:hypothetical protein
MKKIILEGCMAISQGVSFFTGFKIFKRPFSLKMARIVKTTIVGEENMFSDEDLKITAFSEAYISSKSKKKTRKRISCKISNN